MAAEVSSFRLSGSAPSRNDSTLTAAWPAKFDIKNDIFIPGKVETFIRELNAGSAHGASVPAHPNVRIRQSQLARCDWGGCV